ncbi:MAG: hypothetical protein KUG82_05655 [Pseudomonadales bacterium]|nr:hypothetical protein [Pseudomonadales bacterium]
MLHKYLNGEPEDLIEVYFLDMTVSSWASLFKWLKDRVILLDCQHGRIPISELSYEKFISDELSYIAYIKSTNKFEISLSIIEKGELTIDISISEIISKENSEKFISGVSEIATVIDSKNYMICPELDKKNAFYINGKFVTAVPLRDKKRRPETL